MPSALKYVPFYDDLELELSVNEYCKKLHFTIGGKTATSYLSSCYELKAKNSNPVWTTELKHSSQKAESIREVSKLLRRHASESFCERLAFRLRELYQPPRLRLADPGDDS